LLPQLVALRASCDVDERLLEEAILACSRDPRLAPPSNCGEVG
jgi:hypothetical protein